MNHIMALIIGILPYALYFVFCVLCFLLMVDIALRYAVYLLRRLSVLPSKEDAEILRAYEFAKMKKDGFYDNGK